MEMESTRRPSFDRSREPGLKKPRLAGGGGDDRPNPNPNGRPFVTRAGGPPGSGRFRAGGSDAGSDPGRAEAYQPQPQPQVYQELVSQYKTALAELTFNSKPIITNLTIIAGENLHAAKAVAATICNNILEVPSDQKLPSLYLLDSIVKNIGRDYIRYFASRLPEVFCKAYRHVDASMHQSMRHLFGTWKGVFPLQTLQSIEKELGFTTAVNGSGGPSTRPDSQAQRPQHSIHVNPKYLERQRLQQSSSRVKGMASDVSLPTANSSNDVERLDRVSAVDAGRPWVDSSAKIHNIQRSQRDVQSDPLSEKKIGVYGDLAYSSDISRNSFAGVGRTGGKLAEPGHGRTWFAGGSGMTEAISGQRNGFPAKPGISNYPSSKSSNVDLQLQPAPGGATRSLGRLSSSWKNSEEEEFMWDMHSRLPGHDAAKISINSRKDLWNPDDSEKLDLEDLPKSRGLHDVGSRFDGESSSDSMPTEQKEVFGNRLSSPWSMHELQSSDRLVDSGTSATGIGHSEGYSLSMLAPRPSGLSHVGSTGFGFSSQQPQPFQPGRTLSPSGQSPMLQHPLSPSFPAKYPPQQLPHSVEPTYAQLGSFPQLDYNPSLSSGNLSAVNFHGKVQKLQLEDQDPSPSGPTLQLGVKYPLSKPQSDHLHSASSLISSLKSETSTPEYSDPLANETSRPSSTSSLLAAVMKSGILSKFSSDALPSGNSQDVRQVQSNSKPPPSHGPPPPRVGSSAPKVKSTSLSTALLHEDTSADSDGSQRTKEPLSLPTGPSLKSGQASDVTPSPISDLLSSLVAKGLISASKSETPLLLSSQKPSITQNLKSSVTGPSAVSVTSVPAASKNPASPQKQKPSLTAQKSSTIQNLKSSVTRTSAVSVASVPAASQKPASLQNQKPSITAQKRLKTQNLKSSVTSSSAVSVTSVPAGSQKPASSQNQKSRITAQNPASATSVPASSPIVQSDTVSEVSPVESAVEASVALPKCSSKKAENLIGLQFKPDVIRELHPTVISSLFDDLPHQCSICGLRLKLRETLDRHLEWHTWRKTNQDGINEAIRRWYVDADNWIAGKAGLPMDIQSIGSVDEADGKMDEDMPMVLADDDQSVCVLCGELFEDYYDQDLNEWMFRGAIHMALPEGDSDLGSTDKNLKGPIIHASCSPDMSASDLGIGSSVKMETDV